MSVDKSSRAKTTLTLVSNQDPKVDMLCCMTNGN